ncbi:MAG: hypothetical protein KC505_05070 [Myxococcales bacterium]|nr:hypothetical protein [Myxococcales bacterium]USN51001.1 MAG: hypothetical protein H6731_00880 [Myxococcales bacterium]
MKKISFFLVLFLFSLCCSSLDVEQNQQPKMRSIKVNSLALALGFLDLHFGVKTSKNTSIILALDTHFFWPPASLAKPSELFGIGGGLGVRFSPFSLAHESGWFIEALLRTGYSGLVPTSAHFVVIPSIESGYAWLFQSGLTLSTGLSLNYIFAPNKNEGAWVPQFPIPLFNLTIGYIF